jgi:hypothetical protein
MTDDIPPAEVFEELLLQMAETGETLDGKRIVHIGEDPVTHRQLFKIVKALDS